MEENKKTKTRPDKTSVTTTIKTTTPKDEPVHDVEIQGDAFYNQYEGKYRKGYIANTRVETDDPRVVRVGILIITIFMISLGIGICYFDKSAIPYGIGFIILAIITMISVLKKTREKEKEYLNNSSYNPKDTQPIKDFIKDTKDGIKEAKKQSKFNRKRFFLIATPIYIIITLVLSFLIDYFLASQIGFSIFNIMLGYLAFFGLLCAIIIFIFL